MEAVEQAAREARYNEAIIVNVTSEENPHEIREIILTATLDETKGGIVWNDVSSSNQEEDVGIVRHLRTKRWVLPMLNDHKRNQLYDDAIRAASREAVRRFTNQNSSLSSTTTTDDNCIRALDIGTGSGLLAMLTVKHTQAALAMDRGDSDKHDASATPKIQVTSLEMASAMARLAKLTIASNKLQDDVHVLEEHSCAANLDHKFLICTSELLESGLLGEGILPSLRDAWQRHLDPDAVVVPQKARVYAQLIESRTLVGTYRGPNPTTEPIRLSTSSDGRRVLLGGDEAGQGIIVPLHAESLFSGDPAARVLTAPIMVMEFSFSNDLIPGPEGRSRTTRLVPTASGIVHGVLFWWELDLWDDITYSTQQGKEPWQDHWQQCVFVMPMSHEQCPQVSKGEAINLKCSHTDDRMSFALVSPVDVERSLKRQRPGEDVPQQINRIISPERALQLNDVGRLSLIRRAIKYALEVQGCDASFLDISDFCLCATMAALEGATLVSSLESSSGEIPITSARVSRANGLPRTFDGEVAQYQIVQCHATNLTHEVLQNKAAAIVAAEPYYQVLEGWHLQEALNYFYLLRSLRERGLATQEALSVPRFASIVVSGIQCDKLAQAYQGCGDDSDDALICGFNHSILNQYGDRYHQHAIAIRACEYEYSQLTGACQILRLCYDESCSIHDNNVWTRLPFQQSGTCHGMLCWIEYGMQTGGTHEEILSTKTHCHRQLFQLLSSPATISGEDIGRGASLLCRMRLGGLDGVEDYQLDLCIEMNKALAPKP
jgi:protein arginine N-methyltransferase 7